MGNAMVNAQVKDCWQALTAATAAGRPSTRGSAQLGRAHHVPSQGARSRPWQPVQVVRACSAHLLLLAYGKGKRAQEAAEDLHVQSSWQIATGSRLASTSTYTAQRQLRAELWFLAVSALRS